MKSGRVLASDASSLFGGGGMGFPDSSPANAGPVKISSQKASAAAAADLFGPPPPSSEPALFAVPTAAAPLLFAPTTQKQSISNPHISSTSRDPFQLTERLPPSLVQKPKAEKTSPVPPSSDRLFPPPELSPKNSNDFFSSHQSNIHADSTTVNTKSIPSIHNDSRAQFSKAPTPALSLSLPFSTNASVTDYAPPKGSPAAPATVGNSSPSQSASTFFQSTSPTESSAQSLFSPNQNSFGEVSSKSGDSSDMTPPETSGNSKVLPTSFVTEISSVKSKIEAFNNQPVIIFVLTCC